MSENCNTLLLGYSLVYKYLYEIFFSEVALVVLLNLFGLSYNSQILFLNFFSILTKWILVQEKNESNGDHGRMLSQSSALIPNAIQVYILCLLYICHILLQILSDWLVLGHTSSVNTDAFLYVLVTMI